jgi:hypothetical protein
MADTSRLEKVVDSVGMKLFQRVSTVIGIPIAIAALMGAYSRFGDMRDSLVRVETTLQITIPSLEYRLAVLESRLNNVPRPAGPPPMPTAPPVAVKP